MSIQPVFFDWVKSGIDPTKAPYNACSPNLHTNRGDLDIRFGVGDYLGCHADRPIRTGTTPSEHSWGAALDWRYPPGTQAQVLNHLINTSKERHIVAIHDYLGCRIWRAGRTTKISDAHTLWWKTQPVNPANGMGQSWATYIHIVTDRDGFFDTELISERLNINPEVPKVMDFNLLHGGGTLMLPDKSPVRFVDTRTGLGVAAAGKISQNHPLKVQMPDMGVNVQSAIVNVTLVAPEGDGFARVFGVAQGDGSNINVVHGQSAEPSPTIVRLDSSGSLTVQLTRTTAHVLVDFIGAVAD